MNRLSPLTSRLISLSCAVCFGQIENINILKAFNWGFLILLGLTFAILGVLAYAIYKIEIRQKKQA